MYTEIKIINELISLNLFVFLQSSEKIEVSRVEVGLLTENPSAHGLTALKVSSLLCIKILFLFIKTNSFLTKPE